MENQKEIWKDIPGYEGHHQASSHGRIRSLDRDIVMKSGATRFKKGRILSQYFEGNRYRSNLCVDGKCTTYLTHQLIAMAFLGHTPNGQKLVVDHIDNDSSNNRLSNLQLISQRENATKDKNNGTSIHPGVFKRKGNKNWSASIRNEDGEQVYLGSFTNELDASKEYQKALSSINNGENIETNVNNKKTSQYKGVYWCNSHNKWKSKITINKKSYHLGSFDNEENAAEAYKIKKERITQLLF